jgi:hypothetical protein
VFEDPNVSVRQVDRRDWTLIEKVRYQGAYEVFVVPAGFRTDFASVPRPIVWLIPTYGVYTPAAILHDFLCASARSDEPLLSRADADGLFRRSLRELGVSAPKRWAMWAGVRAWSRLSGARPRDVVRFLLVAMPSVAFLLVPVLVVTTWLAAAWMIEAASWLIDRMRGRPRPAPDLLRLRT